MAWYAYVCTLYEMLPNPFPRWPCRFTICERPSSSTSLSYVGLPICLIFTILKNSCVVASYGVTICISLLTPDVEHLFIY